MRARPFTVLIVLSVAWTQGAVASVHHLVPGDSIAAAAAAASPGDTLALAPGEYPGNVSLEVPVALLGGGGAVLRGGYTGTVLHITAPGTTVEGVAVREAGTSLTQDMACILVEADDVTIRNCHVSESLHGIYVKGGLRTRLVGNRVEGRLDLIESDRGNGIHLWNTRGNRVEGNEIFNVRDGIYFSFADSTEVVGNHIHHVRYGLHYMYSNNNRFVANRFTLNVAGAALMYSKDIRFERNLFAHCRGFRAYGVLLQSMDRTWAEGNLILDNSRGIFLNNSSGNVLTDNDVVDNDLAIQLNGGCNNNRFSGNNFINNLSDLILDVSDYDTSWEEPGGGNYWSAYNGYDLDGDGIGDRPHEISRVFQLMETRVPEVRFLAFSPAAAFLEVAERVLPILDLGAAEDGLPLVSRAGNRGVPWPQVQGVETDASPTAAGMFLAVALLPLWLVSRCGRRRRN